MPNSADPDLALAFIRRWDPVPDDSRNHYALERAVHFHHRDGATSLGRIDLYKKILRPPDADPLSIDPPASAAKSLAK